MKPHVARSLRFLPPPIAIFMIFMLLLSFNSKAQSSSCLAQIDLEDMDRLPIALISLKFHFVKDAQGNNFQCSDPNGNYYAPTYVQQIIDGANTALTNPADNTFGSSPDLPDARIRYVLAGNSLDPCASIIIENTVPSGPFSDDAIHIIVRDGGGAAPGSNGNCSTGGVANPGLFISLFNIHCNVFQAGWTDVARYGTLMNHEIGHWFGLCHAYAAENPCNDMEPEQECGGPTSTVAATGACNTEGNFNAVCNFGNGNNMMGENGIQSGLTLCQWATWYGNMENLRPKPPYLQFVKGECITVEKNTPSIVIPSGTIEQWDDYRFVDQPIEIESGATLIITCVVRMAPEQPIIVHRGGRLFVSGGTVTSQSPECLWGGIYVSGNSTMTQPDVVTARTAGATLPANSAGVVWLNSAIISNAPTAITTKGYGATDLPAYWGGLVMANSSDFINNSRAVEFLKYEFVNKSYFNQCEIKKDGATLWAFNRGVSIWACSGIEFEDTHIDGTLNYGIQCYNAVATVTDGSIRNTQRGMDCNFSMPNIFIDPDNNPQKLFVDGVEFEGNGIDIFSNASPNMIYPFTIQRNQFRRLTPSAPGVNQILGIRMVGEALFLIGPDNGFWNKFTGISLTSNGVFQNRIFCNVFSTPANGIFSQYDNRGLLMTGNSFYSNVGQEINVDGTTANKGRINELQQAGASVAAGNCFLNPASAIKADKTKTESFDYFVHNLNNSPVPCEKPTNNLTDLGINNYNNKSSISEFDAEEYCLLSKPPENISEENLDTVKLLVAQLKIAWDNDPENESAKLAYLQAAAQQVEYLDILLKSAGEVKDFAKVEGLLLGEKTNKAIREAVGLRTSLKNFIGAQALLDSMPVLEQDDQWFKDIMAVNFAMFQTPGLYELTTAQENILMTIAGTPHSLMSGYACALLSICKGYQCEDTNYYGYEEERSYTPLRPLDGVKLYPNPASGQLSIECPSLKNEMLSLDMFDLSGRIVKSLRFNNTGIFSFDCSGLPQGPYHIRLYHNSGMVHNLKVSILH